MARTLIYLKEKGIGTREELDEKISNAKRGYNDRQDRIKIIEARLNEISELQRNIGTYSKTKDVYNEWQKLKKHQPTKWEKFRNATHPADDFYEARRSDIALCQAAKNYFNAQGYGKNKPLPTIQSLKKEYAILAAEKKKLYNGYGKLRDEMIDLQKARQNVQMFLDTPRQPHQLERNKSYEHGL
jgi:predicted nuclease with TOPRIM domain